MQLSLTERTLLLYAAGLADRADMWTAIERCGGGSVPSELAAEGLKFKGLVRVDDDGTITLTGAGHDLARKLVDDYA